MMWYKIYCIEVHTSQTKTTTKYNKTANTQKMSRSLTKNNLFDKLSATRLWSSRGARLMEIASE